MEILDRPSLKDLTTLRLGGQAQCGIRIRSEADWDELSAFLEREGLDPVCLGRGSNILAREGELPLALIMQSQLREISGMELPDGRVRIAVDAGTGLGRLLAGLQRRGLSGLEGLVGIPASLGGAVAMNAGAYGCETALALNRVRVWTPRHGRHWLDRERLDWAYREFNPGLDTFFCITEAELDLEPSTSAEVRHRMRDCFRAKKKGQPVTARTCGCVFKNPADGPAAGALLDQCGFRGFFLGNVGFSEKHANFLINSGGGKADQALELIDRARTAVLRRFDIDLEREVRLLE
jgi:UDP-N-acetylmuramate dehydrogenase